MRIRWILLLYIVVELAAFIGLSSWLGAGWAILITLAAAVAGYVFLASRGRRVIADLGRAARNEIRPSEPLPDTALLGMSSVLVILPGLVTSLLGVALMAGPVRRAARPVVTAFGARRFAGLVSAVGARTVFLGGEVIDGDVIDSDVIDGDVVAGSVVNSGANAHGPTPRPGQQRQLPPAH
ncbi:FxsA family protein [Gordonia crocea]|uniref:Membrane protein FxsA n=1 Tax=Gordonia crocea TaxID=589162 RepID=A0A7I9UYH3_9ACTN|nr:FxsA family protein [Gordonia crocea]GED97982.1 membrane protein FxsA [Gordonia crocea]